MGRKLLYSRVAPAAIRRQSPGAYAQTSTSPHNFNFSIDHCRPVSTSNLLFAIEMLVERLDLSSSIHLDDDSVSLIAEACNMLRKGGTASVDELWPGETYDFKS